MDIQELIGKTIVKIENHENTVLYFHTSNNEIYEMYPEIYYNQEYEGEYGGQGVVFFESDIFDMENLIGSPILLAEKSTLSHSEYIHPTDMRTWYELITSKGHVKLEWYVNLEWYGQLNEEPSYYNNMGITFCKSDLDVSDHARSYFTKYETIYQLGNRVVMNNF